MDTTGDFGTRLQALFEVDRDAFGCPQVDSCVCQMMVLAHSRPFGRPTASDQALRQVLDDLHGGDDSGGDDFVPR